MPLVQVQARCRCVPIETLRHGARRPTLNPCEWPNQQRPKATKFCLSIRVTGLGEVINRCNRVCVNGNNSGLFAVFIWRQRPTYSRRPSERTIEELRITSPLLNNTLELYMLLRTMSSTKMASNTPCTITTQLGVDEVLIKPSNGLEKGLLLGKLLPLDLDVAADGKAVLGARVQGDLVGLLGLLEDLLGLVALLRREDFVRLGGGNGQRAADGAELFLGDEAGVRDEADVDAVLVVAHHVLPVLVVALLGPETELTFAPKQ